MSTDHDRLSQQIAELRQVFVNCLTPRRLTNIANAVIEKAEAGDMAAARLVLRYGLERPRPAASPGKPPAVAPAPRPPVPPRDDLVRPTKYRDRIPSLELVEAALGEPAHIAVVTDPPPSGKAKR